MTTETAPSGMLLHGMQAIADFLGVQRRIAYYMAETDQIPTFKMGRTICANRASLTAAVRAREAQAIHKGKDKAEPAAEAPK